MKITSIKTGKDHLPHLKTYDVEQFLDRITQDKNDFLISFFRQDLPRLEVPRHFRRYSEIPRVCPAVELKRQDNGALVFHRYNGIVVLDVKGIVGHAEQEAVKTAAMALPFTVAAFTGASGQSVKLLVRVARENDTVPQDEHAAEVFYLSAHRALVPLYNTLIAPYSVVPDSPGLFHSFLLPLDESPRRNLDPSEPHYSVNAAASLAASAVSNSKSDLPAAPKAPVIPPPLHEIRSYDRERYDIYERLFGECVRRAREITGLTPLQILSPVFLTELARQLALGGMPQEEAFEHTWQHLRFKPDSDRDTVRTIIDSTYDTELEDYHKALPVPGAEGETMRRLVRRLEQRYVFRRNTIMGYTEMRRNTTAHSPWVPVTNRVVGDLTIELQMDDIPAWDRDVSRYIQSSRVRDYSLIDEYLCDCPTWDGRDHIRALARTVPTDTPQWPDWFHTFFLAMVAQWQGRNIRFGNAIVPLLISRQGYHKSDFCRQLLPRELRAWGYSDSLSLAEERPVLQAMTQMLLINLDEFNQISPRKQQGFLKNILQLPAVKVQRPYARHVEDIPRLASFIATTNQADVLADPSGSRRFIGIYVTGDIDTHQAPNYPQLFAQAKAELDDDARYWFDAAETEELMRHNLRFQQRSDFLEFFFEYFAPGNDEASGEWMTAAALLAEIKKRAGAALKVPPTVNKFARELRGLPDIQVRRSHSSDIYLVSRK